MTITEEIEQYLNNNGGSAEEMANCDENVRKYRISLMYMYLKEVEHIQYMNTEFKMFTKPYITNLFKKLMSTESFKYSTQTELVTLAVNRVNGSIQSATDKLTKEM